MKNLVGTLVISSVIIYVIMFFGAALIVENILALNILLALIVSVLFVYNIHASRTGNRRIRDTNKIN